MKGARTAPSETIDLDQPGVYLIHCRPTGAFYVGAAKVLRTRLSNHLSTLRRHRHDIPRLQRDWELFGPDNFEWSFLPVARRHQGVWEETLIHLTNALEHQGGYNRMIGKIRWSLCAQIRDTERKLKRSGKFAYRKGIHPDEELTESYFRTFQKPWDSQPLYAQEMRNLRSVEIGERLRSTLLNILLAQFQPYDFRRASDGKTKP